MLIQNTHLPKLIFCIAIAFLVLGLSVISTIPAQAEQKLVGHEGGEVYAGNNSHLTIPSGALTNQTLITADSLEEVITTDDETILTGLNTALSRLDSQYAYINGLSTVVNNPSGEWANYVYKLSKLVAESLIIKSKGILALTSHNLDDDEDALVYTRAALDKLDVLDADLDSGLATGKIGSVAYNKIKAYNNDIRAALELVESLHYEVVVFELGPEGTTFLVPAELVIPWDVIDYSDGLFWYSGDGEVIDLIEMEYFIDDVNQTVNFLIEHFSEYYYPRR